MRLGHTASGKDRPHVDDTTASLPDHWFCERPRAKKCAGQIDFAYPTPLVERHVNEEFRRCDTGIVEENVSAAELGYYSFARSLNRCLIGHVGFDNQRLTAGAFDGGGGLLQFRHVAADDREVRAGFGQRDRRSVADPTTGAGYDRYMTLNVEEPVYAHRVTSPFDHRRRATPRR